MIIHVLEYHALYSVMIQRTSSCSDITLDHQQQCKKYQISYVHGYVLTDKRTLFADQKFIHS